MRRDCARLEDFELRGRGSGIRLMTLPFQDQWERPTNRWAVQASCGLTFTKSVVGMW